MDTFSRRLSCLTIGLTLCVTASASNFQDFSGITYSNPAELTFLVQDTQLILGNEYFSPSPKMTYDGIVFVPDPSPMHNNVTTSGTSSNIDYTTYPYGRIAKRLSKQWVVGVDVTKPFSSDIVFPDDSPARYSVTYSGMQSADIAPNIAYQFTGALSKLAIGAGLDAMYYVIDLDAKYPSLPTPTSPFGSGSDLSITDHAINWAYGWHIGAIYRLFRGTILGLSYFSAVNQHFNNGSSSVTDFPSSNTFATTLYLPATSNFSIMQILSDKWTMLFKLHYSQWDTLQEVTLYNIAGPAPTYLMNLHYRNTWRVDLGSRYNLTPKLALGGLFAYDQTPTNNTDRTLALPGVNQTILGASVTYKLTKALSIEAQYGHIFAINAPVNYHDPNTGIVTQGNVNISGNIVGLQLALNT